MSAKGAGVCAGSAGSAALVEDIGRDGGLRVLVSEWIRAGCE